MTALPYDVALCPGMVTGDEYRPLALQSLEGCNLAMSKRDTESKTGYDYDHESKAPECLEHPDAGIGMTKRHPMPIVTDSDRLGIGNETMGQASSSTYQHLKTPQNALQRDYGVSSGKKAAKSKTAPKRRGRKAGATSPTSKTSKNAKKCAACGATFYAGAKAKTCSDRCRKRLQREAKKTRPAMKSCAYCSTRFQAKSTRHVYCTPSCRNMSHRVRRRQTIPALVAIGIPQDTALDRLENDGLEAVSGVLESVGYTYVPKLRQWQPVGIDFAAAG